MDGVGDPRLPPLLEQAHHRLEGLVSRRGTLEAEADEVHADETGTGRVSRMTGEDLLVADRHPRRVDAVLGAPKPCGLSHHQRDRPEVR